MDQTSLPYEKGRPTSQAAAKAGIKRVNGDRFRVLRHIMLQGSHGATDDEIEVALGLPHTTASARRRGLYLDSEIAFCGETRKTRRGRAANVWVAKALVAELLLTEVKLAPTREEKLDHVLEAARSIVAERRPEYRAAWIEQLKEALKALDS